MNETMQGSPTEAVTGGRKLLALALIFGFLVYQISYWPLRWEFNIRSASLGLPLLLVVVLLAKPQQVALAVRQHGALFIAVLVFFMLALVSSLQSADQDFALARWVAYLGHGAFGVGVWLSMTLLGVRLSEICYCLLLACLSMVTAEILVVFENWLMFTSLAEGRIYTPTYFNHIRNFAHVPTVGLLLALWLAWSRQSLWLRAAGWVAALLFSLLIVWAGGRVSLLIVPAAVVLLVLLAYRRRRLARLGQYLLIAVMAVVIVFASGQDQMLASVHDRVSRDIGALQAGVETPEEQDQVAVPTSKTSVRNLGSGRLGLWQDAWQGFVASPVLGAGGDAFLVMNLDPEVRPNQTAAHPHNWLVRLLLEYGLAGFLLVAFIVVQVLKPLKGIRYMAIGAEREAVAIIATVTFMLMGYGLLSGTLYYAWPLNVFALCLGSILAWRDCQPSERRR